MTSILPKFSLLEILNLLDQHGVIFDQEFVPNTFQKFGESPQYFDDKINNNPITKILPELKHRINAIIDNNRSYNEAMQKFYAKSEQGEKSVAADADDVTATTGDDKEGGEDDIDLDFAKSKPSMKEAKKVLNTSRYTVRKEVSSQQRRSSICTNNIDIKYVHLYKAGTSTAAEILPTLLKLLERTKRWWEETTICF